MNCRLPQNASTFTLGHITFEFIIAKQISVSAASTTFFLMRNLSERICFFIVITNKRGNHDKPYLSARDRSILEKTYHGLRAIDAIKSGLRESACIKL